MLGNSQVNMTEKKGLSLKRRTQFNQSPQNPLLDPNFDANYDSMQDSMDDDSHGNTPKHTIMSITDAKKERNDDEKATQPFFNNQNTVLMVARSSRGDIMLMHETRIFYFNRKRRNPKENDLSYAEAAQHFTNLILAMLTTRKYRLLTSFYLLWRVLDYGMLVALVAALFFTGDTKKFDSIIWNNIFIFLVVGLEIFYDVLEFIVKIWLLNRVSIYIGFALYILYGAAFSYPNFSGNTKNIWDPLVIWLLSLRFAAFIFEEVIDFCIDLELESDFAEGTIMNLDVPYCTKNRFQENIALMGISEKDCTIELAKGWEFKGSIFVWTAKNTFTCQVTHPNRDRNIGGTNVRVNRKYYRCLFHFMFAITYCVIGIPLLVIILISVIVLTLIRMCSKCKTDTILDECFHRYSY
eukprot:475268_1